MKKKLPSEKCVNCLCVSNEITRDHVFPKAWYPSTAINDMWKWQVPSCRQCNKRYGEIEEDLLIRFAMCLDPNDPSCAGIVEKGLRAITPSCAKNDKDRRARLAKRRKLLEATFEGTGIPLQAAYPNFGLNPHLPIQAQVALPIPAKSIQRLAEKIVRGIFYIEDQKYVEPPYDISYYVLHDSGVGEIVDVLNKYGTVYAREPGIVVNRAVAHEDSTSSLFLIEIWNRFKIYAAVQNGQEEAEG